MTLAPKDEPTTELERQLRGHLALIDYFARKCLEGCATPAETLQAIRETAAPFITPILDDQVLVLPGETEDEPVQKSTSIATICPTNGRPCTTLKECEARPKCLPRCAR